MVCNSFIVVSPQRSPSPRQIAEHLFIVAAIADGRRDAEQLMRYDRHVLLEDRTEILHHRGFERRVLALLQHTRHRERHLAQRHEMRDKAADYFRTLVAAAPLQFADHFNHEQEAREIALRSRTLEGEFRRHLAPAAAFAADEHAVRHEGVLEDDFVEMRIAREVPDRADGDAVRVLQIDDELGQTGMFRFRR
jgi:hypothetical protein